jgi:SAM-dependent methyltransferase
LPLHGSLLEIGCANSVWLPYFARLGFRVAGIDYSEIGCAQTRAAFDAAGVDAELVCADAFSPPESFIERFDAVFTLGVLEHFDDTAKAIAAFARFLRSGGVLLTVVPNVRGANGLVQRVVNPRVLRMHVPLTPAALSSAQTAAGLTTISSRYFIPSNFGVLNLNDLDPASVSTRIKQNVVRNLGRLSRLTWMADRMISLPSTRMFAGYVVSVATKPAVSSEPGRAADVEVETS